MRLQLATIAAGALLAAIPLAQSAHAAPNAEIQGFLDGAAAKADARLAGAGVDLASASVKVRARVGSEGRLNGLTVVESSGSRDTDAAVHDALKRLDVGPVPAALAGRSISLTLGDGPIVQAKAR